MMASPPIETAVEMPRPASLRAFAISTVMPPDRDITPTTPGPLTFKARAHTASATGPITQLRTIHVGGTTLPPVSRDTFFSLEDIPSPKVWDADDQAVELGLRISVDRPGSLVGVYLRRGNYRGPVTARIYASNGVLIGWRLPTRCGSAPA